MAVIVTYIDVSRKFVEKKIKQRIIELIDWLFRYICRNFDFDMTEYECVCVSDVCSWQVVSVVFFLLENTILYFTKISDYFIHFHSFFASPCAVAAAAHTRRGKFYIFIIHNDDAVTLKSPIFRTSEQMSIHMSACESECGYVCTCILNLIIMRVPYMCV